MRYVIGFSRGFTVSHYMIFNTIFDDIQYFTMYSIRKVALSLQPNRRKFESQLHIYWTNGRVPFLLRPVLDHHQG